MKTFMLAVLFTAVAVAPAAADQRKELELMQQFMTVMDGYFDVIDRTHAIASEPDKAAILQLQKLKEIFEERGELADMVKILEDVVGSAPSPTVRNAAAVMLADTLKETGSSTRAVDVLREALERNLARGERGQP